MHAFFTPYILHLTPENTAMLTEPHCDSFVFVHSVMILEVRTGLVCFRFIMEPVATVPAYFRNTASLTMSVCLCLM